MSPSEIRSMEDRQIVEMIVSIGPSEEAVAWLAAVVSDDVAYEGVKELRRRFGREFVVPRTESGRMVSARTVTIDPERWRSFFHRRRIALVDVGISLMDPPRCATWASVMASRGKVGLYALDDLATGLGLRVDDLIDEVGTDEERARLSVCV